MKITIYREPNRLKRWWQRQFFTIGVEGQELTLPRIRYWPFIVWLGHNLLVFFIILATAVAGRTPSFDASAAWYAPLRFILELMR